VYLISKALILCIFALAYDLTFGYTGLLSLGHSVFFGASAYVVGIVACTQFEIKNPLVLFGAAMFSGAVFGLVIGFFATFTRGIYLALVTFAFAQIFTLIIMTDPGGVTLGENGIVGLRPPALDLGGLRVDLFRGTGLYYLVLGLFIASYLLLRLLTKSQVGDILIGVRENEARLLGLGYHVRSYKIFAFTVSAVFSALAGTLWSFLANSITPAAVDWIVGAEVLLVTILGGPGTLVGPVVGAFLVTFAESFASSWIGGGNWLFVMGGLYIAVVMLLPGGIFNTKFLAFLRKESDRE
ncbi:MAG: branched-chain amino acid ABC transporter permease, partial [Thermodesulfobacteriota bacterium]